MNWNLNKMKAFEKQVKEELLAARKKFPHAHVDYHHSYGVIKEELDEFWDEVRKQTPDEMLILKELIQIGAMAQRAAEDLGLIEADSTNIH